MCSFGKSAHCDVTKGMDHAPSIPGSGSHAFGLVSKTVFLSPKTHGSPTKHQFLQEAKIWLLLFLFFLLHILFSRDRFLGLIKYTWRLQWN